MFHLSYSAFASFSIPHLEWSPDVEQGEGENACLTIRTEVACGVHGEKCWNNIKVCLDAIKYNLM